MKKKQLPQKPPSLLQQFVNKMHANDISGMDLLLNSLTPEKKLRLFSTALIATTSYQGGEIIVDREISHNLLSYAISQKNLKATQLFLQHNAPVDFLLNNIGLHAQNMTLFFYALHWGAAEIAVELLKKPEIDVNTGGKDNEERATSAFAFACTNYPIVAREMLKHNGLKLNDIFETNKENVLLPLIRAVAAGINKTNGSLALINDLLHLYQKENKPIPMSAFYLACEEQSGILFNLFHRFGVSVTQTENYQKIDYISKITTCNAVSIACSHPVSDNILLKTLLDKYGDDSNVINIKAREMLGLTNMSGIFSVELSGLMRAILNDDLEKVKLLIEKGANLFDTAEYIPIQESDLSDYEKKYFAPLLSSSKRDKNAKECRIIIEFAFESENQELIEYVMRRAIAADVDPEIKRHHFHRGLLLAMRYKIGIEYFSDFLNIPMYHIQSKMAGKSISSPLPLCYAIAKKMDMRIIKQLIAAGAEINPAYNSEKVPELSTYPLATALAMDNVEVMDYLIEQKVDLTVPLLFSDIEMSLISFICLFKQNLSTSLKKLLELWKNEFFHKKIPEPDALELCLLHESAEYLHILLSYKNSLFKDSSFFKDTRNLFNKLFIYFPDKTNTLKVLLKEGLFDDIKFIDEKNQYSVLVSCMLSNKENFFKTYLKHRDNLYANGKEILEKGCLSPFSTACALYKKSQIYLNKLIEKYLLMEYPDFDRKELANSSPLEIAVLIKDALLLSRLLEHGFVLTLKLIDLINENKSPDSISVALQKLPSTFDKNLFNNVFSQIGYQHEPIKHPMKSNCLSDKELYFYRNNLLKECIDNIKRLNEEKNIKGLHFLLFRFYETLCQSHLHYCQYKTGKNPSIILSFKKTKDMRNALAHQYEILTAEDYHRLAENTLSLYRYRSPLEKNLESHFFPFQWLFERLSQSSLGSSLIERVSILDEQFIKNQAIFRELSKEERFSPDKFLLFSVQECIWLIGENYQQINKILHQQLSSHKSEYKQNIWNDTQGMELWGLMERSLYVRNALSHKIKDEPLSDSFNEHYLMWLGELFSLATERFRHVLNQVKGCVDSSNYMNIPPNNFKM